jgi:hypothetical protein
MKISPSPSAAPLRPRRPPRKWAFWAGFVSFFAVLYAGLASHGSRDLFFLLVADLPLLGLVLVLFRRTRKFGFGMLLATLIFLATALATCGAVFE